MVFLSINIWTTSFNSHFQCNGSHGKLKKITLEIFFLQLKTAIHCVLALSCSQTNTQAGRIPVDEFGPNFETNLQFCYKSLTQNSISLRFGVAQFTDTHTYRRTHTIFVVRFGPKFHTQFWPWIEVEFLDGYNSFYILLYTSKKR